MAPGFVKVELSGAALGPELHVDGSCQRDGRQRVVFGMTEVNGGHTIGKGER
jgi:hypothetical protein